MTASLGLLLLGCGGSSVELDDTGKGGETDDTGTTTPTTGDTGGYVAGESPSVVGLAVESCGPDPDGDVVLGSATIHNPDNNR